VSPSERYALVPDENVSSVHVCLIQLQNKSQPKHLTELLIVEYYHYIDRYFYPQVHKSGEGTSRGNGADVNVPENDVKRMCVRS
jgi:hypothetical protein